MIVIMLGPPGVGKGTQARILSDSLGLRHVATGDLLRAARREGTELGRQAQGFMDRGELVPDSIIIGMVRELLEGMEPESGVVLDGFPRTLPQGEALDAVLGEMGLQVDRVLLLTAPDDVLVRRVAGRRSCPDCGRVYNVHFGPPRADGVCDDCDTALVHRADDAEDTVRNRLEVYGRQTRPLVGYYEGKGVDLRRIDGDRPVADVQRSLTDALN